MKIQDRYEYDPSKDLLGRGGFARVYRAHDTLLHRDVALKVFSNTAGHRYSVLDEIRKVIGLEHPNLLRYYDVILLEVENHLGEQEQTQIGVMELANAGDLKDFARANPGSPLLYKLLKEVLQGLEYLHSKGIIHRDLKAANILLVKQDGQLTAKISDFGISKDMGTGGQSSSMMVGTVEYMAPEQFAPGKYGIDGKVSTNLDLWSFGIMVHELLTDTTPFGSRDGDTTAEQIMAQILSTELPQDIEKLPEPYKSVIRKCLVANARERIRKASELISYFDGTAAAASTSMPDADTRVYPKGGTAAKPDSKLEDDATKAYPKGGAGDSASSAYADATKVYGEKPKATQAPGQSAQADSGKPGSPRRMGILVGAIAALVLALGAGGWVVKEQQAKAVAVAQAAAQAKAAEEKAAVDRARREAETRNLASQVESPLESALLKALSQEQLTRRGFQQSSPNPMCDVRTRSGKLCRVEAFAFDEDMEDRDGHSCKKIDRLVVETGCVDGLVHGLAQLMVDGTKKRSKQRLVGLFWEGRIYLPYMDTFLHGSTDLLGINTSEGSFACANFPKWERRDSPPCKFLTAAFGSYLMSRDGVVAMKKGNLDMSRVSSDFAGWWRSEIAK